MHQQWKSETGGGFRRSKARSHHPSRKCSASGQTSPAARAQMLTHTHTCAFTCFNAWRQMLNRGDRWSFCCQFKCGRTHKHTLELWHTETKWSYQSLSSCINQCVCVFEIDYILIVLLYDGRHTRCVNNQSNQDCHGRNPKLKTASAGAEHDVTRSTSTKAPLSLWNERWE